MFTLDKIENIIEEYEREWKKDPKYDDEKYMPGSCCFTTGKYLYDKYSNACDECTANYYHPQKRCIGCPMRHKVINLSVESPKKTRCDKIIKWSKCKKWAEFNKIFMNSKYIELYFEDLPVSLTGHCVTFMESTDRCKLWVLQSYANKYTLRADLLDRDYIFNKLGIMFGDVSKESIDAFKEIVKVEPEGNKCNDGLVIEIKYN